MPSSPMPRPISLAGSEPVNAGMKRYAVFGHPIKHSRSPEIHGRFAEQTRISLEYRAIDVAPENFAAQLSSFREMGGHGLNCTIPLKEIAFEAASSHSEAARLCGAVNTLYWLEDGRLHGDNTDGCGLVRDLSLNLGIEIKGLNILILGAGGATRGIIGPLINAQAQSLWIANRSEERAQNLARQFRQLTDIRTSGLGALKGQSFDLILNATAASLSGSVPDIPAGILAQGGSCYDLAYAKDPTPFVRWGHDQGARQSADGIGMLVEQAAEAFFLWHGIRPDTGPVIRALSEGARVA